MKWEFSKVCDGNWANLSTSSSAILFSSNGAKRANWQIFASKSQLTKFDLQIKESSANSWNIGNWLSALGPKTSRLIQATLTISLNLNKNVRFIYLPVWVGYSIRWAKPIFNWLENSNLLSSATLYIQLVLLYFELWIIICKISINDRCNYSNGKLNYPLWRSIPGWGLPQCALRFKSKKIFFFH